MTAPQFAQVRRRMTLTCHVSINIAARADVVWAALTDAPRFGRWNPTITAIDGAIREGERIRLHVPGTSRTFTPRISGVVHARRMVWSDGIAPLFRGVRTFALVPCGDGSTDFRMEERFSGVVFALLKNKMPDFRPIFEAFATSLSNEAQRLAQQETT
jgi:hypothetical protein